MADLKKPGATSAAIASTLFSATLHLAMVAAGAVVLPSIFASRRPPEPTPIAMPATSASAQPEIEIELPALAFGEAPQPGAHAEPEAATVSPTGGQAKPRPDTGSPGRGGTNEASQPAINLADRDDGLRLARDLTSHLDRDQIARIRSAKRRESYDDERLTTNPMELTFLATGKGREQERRTQADRDPSMGTEHAASSTVQGADAIGQEPDQPGYGSPPTPVGGAYLGMETASAGAGIVDGHPGLDHRNSASSAFGRPMVDKGNPSVPSNVEGTAKDTTDSRQDVAATSQALTNASTAGGTPGQGPGGQTGPSPTTGSGGLTGPGSQAAPIGYGPGAYGASTVDPRVTAYRRRVLARLWPLWANAFPKWAAAELRQGHVTVGVVILADGSVRDVRVTRPSGIEEFDRNCVAAVHRGAPFEPLPAELGMRTMRWEIGFDATNPVVR